MSRAIEESNRRMLRARDAMDRDYARPLDIATLARIVHVSESHFIRTFRATFAETPHRYLQRQRVERAMYLLGQTQRSITDVCFEPLGYMRWPTVGVPGDGDHCILLERPGPPAMDDTGASEVRALVTKGRAGGNLFFTTDDCQKTYEELLAKGVEFVEGPTDRGYGVDCGLRDPFGNYIRFSQMSAAFATGQWQGTTA